MPVLSFWKEFFHWELCLNKSNAVVIYGLVTQGEIKKLIKGCPLGSPMVESMLVCGRIRTSSCVGKSFIGWSDYKQTALNTGGTVKARPWGPTLGDAVICRLLCTVNTYFICSRFFLAYRNWSDLHGYLHIGQTNEIQTQMVTWDFSDTFWCHESTEMWTQFSVDTIWIYCIGFGEGFYCFFVKCVFA